MNRRSSIGTLAALAAAVGILAATLTGCGSSSTPITPTPTTPSISGVSPSSGSTFGGTDVTIVGLRFPTGAAVTIGGAAAVNVAVLDGGTIKATTPAHASGPADVVVSGSNGAATLPQGFTYLAPSGTNTPPVIKSLSVKGRRANEPANFADLVEPLDVTAVVEDAETPLDKLSFVWSADVGSFSGSGPLVTWTAPGSVGTGTAKLTLTVVESYKAPDPTTGLPIDKENRVSTSSSVSVHDSAKEVANMAEDFLVAFSHSDIGPDQVLRDFSKTCAGYTAEYADVVNNRNLFKITGYSVGTAAVTIRFGGNCTLFPDRYRAGDACAQVPVSWTSTVKATGAVQTVKGTDQVTAFYIGSRWWLCDSDFKDEAGLAGLRFKK